MATTSTPNAAAWCSNSARPAGCATPSPATPTAAAADVIDTRMICLAREILARHNGLADFAFAMQGLGSGAISLAGTPAQKQRWLPRVARGEAIAAFALSEPDAGSDVAAMQCAARIDGDHAVIDGEKTWITNGGIADFYVVFVRTGEAPGARGISAFVVEASTPGLEIAERIDVIAPHPLARLRFDELPRAAGAAHRRSRRRLQGRDAHARCVSHQRRRRRARLCAPRAGRRPGTRRQPQMFGQTLADFQLTQAKLAQMATDDRQRRAADLSRRLAARPGPSA